MERQKMESMNMSERNCQSEWSPGRIIWRITVNTSYVRTWHKYLQYRQFLILKLKLYRSFPTLGLRFYYCKLIFWSTVTCMHVCVVYDADSFSFTLICSIMRITFTTALATALAVFYCKPSLHHFLLQNKSMYRHLIPASVKHKVTN